MGKKIRECLKALSSILEHWYRDPPLWILFTVYIIYLPLGQSMLNLSSHVLLPIAVPMVAFLSSGHEGWPTVAVLSSIGLIFVASGLQLKRIGLDAKSQIDRRLS